MVQGRAGGAGRAGKLGQFNKATASALAGALATLAGSFIPVIGQTEQGAIQTILVTILVLVVPNLPRS